MNIRCRHLADSLYRGSPVTGSLKVFSNSMDAETCKRNQKIQVEWRTLHVAKNANNLSVRHFALSTIIKMQDLIACRVESAVLYIVQHSTCFFFHCFPGFVIIMTSCWQADRTARKDSLFTFAVPYLAEVGRVGRHKERHKHRRNTDIGLVIYQGFCDISAL